MRFVALLLALARDGEEDLVPLCSAAEPPGKPGLVRVQRQADVGEGCQHKLHQHLGHLVHRGDREDLRVAAKVPGKFQDHWQHPDLHRQPFAWVVCDVHATKSHHAAVLLDLILPEGVELRTGAVSRFEELHYPDIVREGHKLVEVVARQRHASLRRKLRRGDAARLVVGRPLRLVRKRLVRSCYLGKGLLACGAVGVPVRVPALG
mmetsp:Transcript_87650/g.225823  ORF Transcript_87650/g.225823 Transcript_87650/m.225823 type:complete len:206 (-) Transcript_87650:594-1211(-)